MKRFLRSIHHVAVICSDYERSKDFYTRILGFEILQEVYREDRRSYKLDLALNGTRVLELFSFPEVPPRVSRPEAAGLRHIAFSVSDLESALAEFRSLGALTEEPRTDEYTGRKFCFLFDPDHLPIELYEE